MPEPLKRQLREQVLEHTHAPSARLKRLVDFLLSPQGLGMRYAPDANHTVAAAYSTREANCISFTLLATALAREAGLDAYARQVDETLAWRRDHNTLYRSQRAAALLEHGSVDDALRHAELALALDPGCATSWSNTGVMHLRSGDAPRAKQAYRPPLDLDADNPGAQFNLVSFYQRTGDTTTARPLQRRLDVVQARALPSLPAGGRLRARRRSRALG